MKQLSILVMLLSIAVVSCTDKVEENIGVDVQKMGAVTAIDQANVVSLSDVQAVSAAAGQDERNKDREQGFSVECITGERGDTLLYVVQKERGGWTIFSSDKRVPPIVAESDNGSFRDLMQIGGAKLWIEATSEEMAVIKHLDDCQLRFTSEEIENNKTFWRSITDPDGFARELAKSLGGDSQLELLSSGHYEWYKTEYATVPYDSIPRLTTTNWSQGTPFNACCPFRSDYPSLRAPAGCVAIAAAQMLYFLHYKLGVPTTAPSQAYCYGNVNDYPNYNWDQFNYTSAIWDEMDSVPLSAAPLIANVGNLVGMFYGNDKSSAYTSMLKNSVFLPYGIHCTNGAYEDNLDYLKTSLMSGMPVIVSAQETTTGQHHGHAFIIDKYKRSCVEIANYYRWVSDQPLPPDQLVPLPLTRITFSYESPQISWIGMNWGWGSWYNNSDQWYTLTGDWIDNGPNYNWNYQRYLVFDFQP